MLPAIKKVFLSVHFLVIVGLMVLSCLPITWPVSLPLLFWVKQGINFVLWTGLFYFNLLYIIPRLLYKSRSGLFLILILCFTVLMVVIDRQIDKLLGLPGLMEKIFHLQVPNVSYKNSPVPDFSTVVMTLGVFGVGIIVAVSQKVQNDKLKEQNMENEKISSELSFLKAQINPHFFFNILHTIYALTDTNQAKAKDSIYRLSHMMRYVLYETKNDLTTLEKEIAFVEDFLQLMQLRLTEKVQVVFDKQQNLRNVEIAPMLFLPFIENAFKHGISNIHPSYVYIGIYQSGDTLQIEVRNSIFDEKSDDLEDSNGIGLANTARRLKLIYPNNHHLEVEDNKETKEFTVKLKIEPVMMLNCIAVDDEPIALDLIVSYISKTPYLKLIERCSNAIEALKAINDHPEIQLIFLDIRMADLSGIELARIIEQSNNKRNLRVIFTTAYDQYALESYKVAALDYLLKPFNYVDFSKAATKALEYFEAMQKPLITNSDLPVATASQKEFIYLKVEYQLVKVNIQDILYIEGLKDYVKVYLQDQSKPLLTLTSLKSLEEKLPSESFMRLHRSFIVALDHIKSVTKNSVQIGSTTIQVTDHYREAFQDFLNKWV